MLKRGRFHTTAGAWSAAMGHVKIILCRLTVGLRGLQGLPHPK